MKPGSTCDDMSDLSYNAKPTWRVHALALLAYLALAALFLWPLLRNIHSHILSYDTTPIVDGCDSFEFVWRYWWLLAVVRYGLHPFDSGWINPPHGDNLLFHSHPWTSELLTLPIGFTAGPVVGYNVMVILMLVFAAWVYHAMLVCAFRIDPVIAWFIGAAFGFSAYLVLRAHWHASMIGACFWGGALAILVASYHQNRFTLPRGIAFAVLFWCTFWNSFVEVFMLAIVAAATAVVGELVNLVAGRRSIRNKFVFYLPVLLGSASLLVLKQAPPVEALAMPLADTSGWIDFFQFPRLSLFATLATPDRAGNWAISFSFVLLALAALGFIYGLRHHTATAAIVLIMTVLTFILAADPYHVPSAMIRRLPLGEGFRVFTRFTPFVVFFLGIPAAWGGHWLWHTWATPARHGGVRRDWGRSAAVAALGLLLLVELFPAGRTIRPVRLLDVPPALQRTLRSGGYCLVVPEGPIFTQHYVTYQVALEAPCVHLSVWDKMDQEAKRQRQTQFPNVYPASGSYVLRANVENPQILPELDALDVRYVLFADKRQLPASVIRGRTLLETDREILLQLPADPNAPALLPSTYERRHTFF